MTTTNPSRRQFLSTMAAAAAASLAPPSLLAATRAPAGRVAVGLCSQYNRHVVDVLSTMFDQLGGLDTLVRGKTVAIKLNLGGTPTLRLGYLQPGMTTWVHPQVVGALVHLLGRAGAQRIRLLESAWLTTEPLQQFMVGAGWTPGDFTSAAIRVEFENTNYLGSGKTYARFMVPNGGLLFPGFDLNQSYRDCDVFISMAKLKEHTVAGVTLSMKNLIGITPCTIYGQNVPEDEPALIPTGGRYLLHSGAHAPPKSAPQPIDLNAPRDDGYRIPRATADLAAARPIHLAIVDGIYTMVGGETPNRHSAPIHPGLLVAGTNAVSTDAACMALMGFDPMADRGAPPFERADNTLRLAEQLGVGTRDLTRVEVAGTPIAKARFDFRKAWNTAV